MPQPKKDDTPPRESAGWNPEPGDTVSGKVVSVSRGWSDWTNSYYPLVTIHDTELERDVDVHAFHATLQSRLMETKPKVGDELEITYVGEERTKDGKRTVNIYRVVVPGATGQEVWDSLSGQDARAAQAARQGQIPADDSDVPF